VDAEAEVGKAHRTEQGTVRSFDESARNGSVFTDDGHEHTFTATALSWRIRHLRLGQRVRIAFADDHVVALQLVTLPDD
jgi:hypothetical protein